MSKVVGRVVRRRARTAPPACGARSTYCAVRLPTRSIGRFLSTPKLALFGAKLRSRGGRRRQVGDVEDVGRESDRRAGHLVLLDAAGDLRLSVGLNLNSLKM